MSATLLGETERILQKHRPADFETTNEAWPECIEYVRSVEQDEAWRARYDSLDSFYAAHEATHPDIRYYARARHEIETADPLTSPGGTPAQRLDRLRRADGS
jgi:hypothetical protein